MVPAADDGNVHPYETDENFAGATPRSGRHGTPKSPVSPVLSEARTLESPAVGSLSSPGKEMRLALYLKV